MPSKNVSSNKKVNPGGSNELLDLTYFEKLLILCQKHGVTMFKSDAVAFNLILTPEDSGNLQSQPLEKSEDELMFHSS